MVDRSDIREQVRQRYADSARSISEQGGGCCGSGAYDGNVAPDGTVVFGSVGTSGKVIGLDMTDEMLDLARRNAKDAGVDNVEFLKGYLEQIPLPDNTVDIMISNCVMMASDKNIVLTEAVRVTKPGGRFAASDVIASEDMDEATRADMAASTGCIAGALTEAEYRDALAASGWTDVEIRYTHEVHEFAKAAIVRAVRP